MDNRTLSLPFLLSADEPRKEPKDCLLVFPEIQEIPSHVNVNASEQDLNIQGDEGSQLWLCLYFPEIAIELLSVCHEKYAQVVITRQNNNPIVYALNDSARQLGITKNMSLNAACALCTDLKIYERDKKKELDNISLLADWAQQFSSHVSIISEDKILIEIKGSLVFFSGMQSLLNKLKKCFMSDFAYNMQIAVSPIPLLSQILSELLPNTIIDNTTHLNSTIGDIPVDYLLKNNDSRLLKIKKIGVKVVRDLWRLPRDGLARRFGSSLLKLLDQLAGKNTLPCSLYKSPIRFEASRLLSIETASQKIIMSAVSYLFDDLELFLRKTDSGIFCLNVRLISYGLNNPAFEITLNFRQVTRSSHHFSYLFSEKLNKISLPFSVIEVVLRVDDVQPFVAINSSVFLSPVSSSVYQYVTDSDWDETMEYLQNRLGNKAIRYLHVEDEINPDWAYSCQMEPPVIKLNGVAMRPLWLLKEAKRLCLYQNSPLYKGRLVFLYGPERIVTGWWRGTDQYIKRDYYIAFSQRGGYLWIYRDLKHHNQWYLHGFFG